MSHQPNDTTGVHRFEKNNYFYGKLLTVRDMAAEQAYHSGIQRALSRHVTDWGVVCGLDVTTTRTTDEESEQEVLEVTVSEGLALDRCGRLLSVADEQHRTVDLPPIADGVETDTISVYVAYDECFTDPVPAAKMENACEEDCEDNRIVEAGDVTVEPGAPADPHKSVAEVNFPSAEDLGIDDPGAQTLDAVGDLLLIDADSTGEELRATVDLSLSESAPDGTVTVDISPPQTGDPNTLVGDLGIPADTLIGPDGFQPPDGEFTVTGGIGEGNSRMAVGGSLEATAREDGFRLDGTLTFDTPSDTIEIPIDFTVSVDGSDIGIEGDLTYPETLIEADAVLSFTDRDDQFVLSGAAHLFRNDDGERERLGTIETTTWEDEAGEVDGVLVDRPVVDDTDDEDIDTDAVLAGPARSYYENEPRTTCPPTDDGRILVGTLTSADDDWASTSFTYGPLVYTNDLLYDALVNHATDFGNPHGAVASIKGVTPDESGDVDITSDEHISVTTGDHSLDFSLTGGGDGFPEEYREYILEKSLRCECNAFADLAARFDMVRPGNIAQTLESHLEAWRAGRADYLDVFQGESALLQQEKDFHTELTEDRWAFVGGTDRYLAAVQRLEETLSAGEPTPLAVAIAQLRVCEAASCLTGDCLDFGRFPFARESIPRPFSHGDYVIDSNDNVQLVRADDGMRLGLEEATTVVDFPTTSYIEFDMFSDVQWDDVILELVAVDRHGEEFTIYDGDADTEWDVTHRFSLAEPDLTRLRIVTEQESADLSRFCRR